MQIPSNRGNPQATDIAVADALPMVGSATREDGQTVLTNIDAELAKLFEDRNVLLTGGVVNYNAAGTILTFTNTLNLELNSKIAGGPPSVIELVAAAASYNFTTDGAMLYAVIDRSGGGPPTSPIAHSSTDSLNLNLSSQYSGQTFTTGSTAGEVESISILLKNNGSSETNLVYVDIWNTDGTVPIGIPIATSVGRAKNLLTPEFALNEFPFFSPVSLAPNTVYAFSIRQEGSWLNALVIAQYWDEYSGGSQVVSWDYGSSWDAIPSNDFSGFSINFVGGGSTTIVSDASTLPAVTSANQEVFLIAKRRDLGSVKKIYFRNGFTIANGQTSSMGSQDDFTDTSFSVVDATDNTKQVKFDVNGSTGTSTTLATTQTSNITLTLPNRTDTLVTLAGSETLRNKRLDDAEVRKDFDGGGAASQLHFYNEPGTAYTAIQAGDGLGSNYTLKLPNTQPSAPNDYLLRNPGGSGSLNWVQVESSSTNGFSVVSRNASGNIGVAQVTATSGVINADNTTNAFKITQQGSGNALVVEDETSDTTPFVIDATGNVGVGIAAPTEKLDLVGNFKLTGGLAYSNVATVAISSNSFALNTGAVVHDITSGTGPLNTITGGVAGKVILVRNSTGTELIVTNNSGSNGLYTGVGDDITIQDKATITLRYDSTATRWNVIGGSGSGGAGGTIDKITQNSHGFAVGDVLYINTSTGLYTKATADNPITAEVVGVVSKITNINTFELTLSGEIKNLTASNYVENVLPAVGEAIFLAPSSVTPTPLSYSDTSSGFSSINSSSSYIGQVFTTNSLVGPVVSVAASISNNGSSETNNVFIELYNVTATAPYIPTGSPIATSVARTKNTLTSTFSLNTFTFATPVNLNPNTRYAFSLRVQGTFSNPLQFSYASGDYTGGSQVYTNNAGVNWFEDPFEDFEDFVITYAPISVIGKLTITEPTTLGQVSLPVGVASGSDTLYVAPKRGVVVGGVNARTELTLTNNGSKNIYTAPADLESAELQGWIYIDAATDYRFYIVAQFTKNGAGTDWNLAYQTAGDTPPAGFSMIISATGIISVTLPNITGYVSSKINYCINGPAVGATFPLTIDSNQVAFTNIQAATSDGLLFKENNGTTIGSVSDTGAWSLGIGLNSSSVDTHIYSKIVWQQSDWVGGTRYSFVSTSTFGKTWQIGTNFIGGQGEFSFFNYSDLTECARISPVGSWVLGPIVGTTQVSHSFEGYSNLFTYGNGTLNINNRNGSNAASIVLSTGGTKNGAWYSSSGFPFAVNNVSGTDLGYVSFLGAWTLGPNSGLTSPNVIRSGASAGALWIKNTANNSNAYLGFTANDDVLRGQIGASNSYMFEVYDGTGTVQGGRISSAGAWTLGPSSPASALTHNLFTGTGGSLNVRTSSGGTLILNATSSSIQCQVSTTASSANLFYNTSNGEIQRSTSSLRYKTDIENYEGGLDTILALRCVNYKSTLTNEDASKVHLGFIAEEVAQVEPKLVEYNTDGQEESVFYATITVPLVKAIQELKLQLDEAKAKIAILESK